MAHIKHTPTAETAALPKWVLVLFIAAALVLAFNTYQLNTLQDQLRTAAVAPGGGSRATATAPLATSGSAGDIIPAGVPKVWGDELQFSFDDISPTDQQRANAAIKKLAGFDEQITLAGAELERYVKILYKDHGGIACEYCCGAKSVIFPNGEAACGCAHSYAMRGLAKYLLQKHPEMSDADILTEVGKMKALFFPGIMQAKAQAMAAKGIPVNYISLATNENRGIEKGQSPGGAMVGGC